MGSEMTPLLVFEGGASEAPPRGTTRIRYAVGGRVNLEAVSDVSSDFDFKGQTCVLSQN